MGSRAARIAGSILMILLGLARGAGGVALLVQGASADPRIQASESAISVLGVMLVALGAALVIVAVGVIRRKAHAWFAGIGLVLAFVVDGALNGYVLYGRPGDAGTIVNGIVAALIVACLVLGRAVDTSPNGARQ